MNLTLIRWLFAFLSVVIKKGWFTEIILIYLPVGYTHEKVDRDLFAPLGNIKKIRKCETAADFPDLTTHAFRKCNWKPTLTSDIFVWDWHAWLDPYMRRIEGFKDFRAFRFFLNEQNDPVMMCKKNILKTIWIGFEESVTQGTNENICLLNWIIRNTTFNRYPGLFP